jgi:hypothetical protein
MYLNPYRIARDLNENGPFTREQADRIAFLKYWIEAVKDEPINTLKVAEFLNEEGAFDRRQAEGIATVIYGMQTGRYDLDESRDS